MSGLSVNVGNAVFSAANVVSSVLPKAQYLQQLLAYGAGGPTKIAGTSIIAPAIIGSPVINPYSFVGQSGVAASGGLGYDTGVADAVQKTMILLCKVPTAVAVGIGTYSTFGDTTLFNLSGTGSNASFGVYGNNGSSDFSSTLAIGATLTSTTSYYLFVADYTATGLQPKYVLSGAVTDGTIASNTRATTANTIRVGANYDTRSPASFAGSIEIASTAIWSGTNLTDADILQLYNFYKTYYGSNITIG